MSSRRLVPIEGQRTRHEICERCGWLVKLIDTKDGKVECPRCDERQEFVPFIEPR